MAQPPAPTGLGVVVLVKQVPADGAPDRLGADARLDRGASAEVNPWCRRAITAGLQLAETLGVECTAISMGPPSAEAVLREARAAGCHRTMLITDPALAGSDALATARVLADAITRHGGAIAVTAGVASVDSSTGAVPAMLAELLGRPMLGPLRDLRIESGDRVVGVVQGADVDWSGDCRLPAVLTLAERSFPPAKPSPESVAVAEPPQRIGADQAGLPGVGRDSRTRVDAVRTEPRRERRREVRALDDRAVERAVALLRAAGVRRTNTTVEPIRTPPHAELSTRPVIVLYPGDGPAQRRLVATARRLTSGGLHAVSPLESDAAVQISHRLDGTDPAGVAAAVHGLVDRLGAVGVLSGTGAWEREVLARLAVRLDSGLLTDLTSLGPDPAHRDRWRGDKVVGAGDQAGVSSAGAVQLVTLHTGVLPEPTEPTGAPEQVGWSVPLPVTGSTATCPALPDPFEDDLANARVVVGIGRPVGADGLPRVRCLAEAVGASVVGTRPVTDAGVLPTGLQVGATGAGIAPETYLAVGISGRPRHLVGCRRAGSIIAINGDPQAPIFDECDLGIVADWRDALAAIQHRLARADAVAATPVSCTPTTQESLT